MPAPEVFLGALDDPRPPQEQAKNYAFAEIVAAAAPVEWVEKQKPSGLQYVLNKLTWRKFPTRNQDGSGSCVAQTLAKLMGILAYLRFGIFVKFSAGHIFMRRKNKPASGMWADDAYQIAQKGVTLEEFMPSEEKDDSALDSAYQSELHKAMGLAISNYIWLPVGDIEAVASVIQTTKKGVMTWFRFAVAEWTAVPVVSVPNPSNHHSVASVDLTLYEGSKALIIDESWGNTFGLDGQRVIKEAWYKARNTHASYPMDFKFDGNVPTPPAVRFEKPLVYIKLDLKTQEVVPEMKAVHEAQKADVVRLQDVLKKEGLMPSNIASTGLYQELTRKAVKAFQYKYAVAPAAELEEVDGKRVGQKTLDKLNQLYA